MWCKEGPLSIWWLLAGVEPRLVEAVAVDLELGLALL
jgi:hypothetical protein